MDGTNSLRINVTVAHSELFREHGRLKGNTLLLYFTVVNSCAHTNPNGEVTRPGALITMAIKRKYTKYRNKFPANYTLLLLDVLICRTLS